MKIAGVEFPNLLLNALRENRLVIFAGAGVSMGPPANLPSFRRLAEQVADGTGQSIEDDETEDRFLGRLKVGGTEVHQRAAEILQRDSPEPTELHRNLLRLYGSPDDVRIVTTNFDLLFEQSAAELFSHDPKVFRSPVLPLGSRFHGIVHPHGAVNEPEETVLTHLDFGRAYLTESDGWARWFMVDLFANYTVLFVGYSHNDTIMTYLTPSLPLDSEHPRFALIGDLSDESDHWRRMGAEPIRFPQQRNDDFSGLYAAVAGLAEHARRGALEWRQRIAIVAGILPPAVDDESADIVAHALATPDLTQFFVESAQLPEWIDWLDQRGHLDCLFAEEGKVQQKAILSFWLAREFAVAHPDAVFSLIERHRGSISFETWLRLAWAVGDQGNSAQTDIATVSKWVHFLTSSMPPHVHEGIIHGLHELAEVCSDLGAFQSLLQLYDAITKPRHEVRLAPEYGNYAVMYQHYLKELWENSLEPNLEYIAYSLLEHTAERLGERYSLATAWEKTYVGGDWDNISRSAIEPHPQDKDNQESVNTLIDIARGCLEWLSTSDPGYTAVWCDRFANSAAPLLRRLAIHAMSARADLSADDKIVWLLERCDVNELEAQHEIFQAAAAAYAQASPQLRADLIKAVSEYRVPRSDYDDDTT